MLKSYLKTAFRNVFKNRLSSGINILGLSAGMALCMLIMVLVLDQNSYDEWHENKDRIYRIITDRTSSSSSSFSTAPLPIYRELLDKQSGIEKAVRVKAELEADAKYGEQVLPLGGLFTEPAFFELFDFELRYGDPAAALRDPFSIILTEASAEKLGLPEGNPVGEVIEMGELGPFTITGIVEEPPGRTHFRFEVLASYSTVRPLENAELLHDFSESWNSTNDGFVYLMLYPGADPDGIEAYFPAISDREYASIEDFRLDFRLQSLADITPSKMLENDMTTTVPKVALYFLSILAFLVLITAFFNYTNLSVAGGLTRAREVGVRKVVGARRSQIFMQFVVEAVIVSLIALIVAMGLLEIVIIPQFEKLFFSQFFEMNLNITIGVGLLFLVFSILVGMVAGILPAFYLSALQPVSVLQSLASLKVFSGLGWRKLLIVGQFVVALIFLITVTVLYQQSSYMLNADYGFDKDNIVNLQLQGQDFEKAKAGLLRQGGITAISGSSLVPAAGTNQGTSFRLPDWEDDEGTHQIFVDENFIANLELEILAGRDFRPVRDSLGVEVIVNETAAERMGWKTPAEAVGQTVIMDAFREGGNPSVIVGIVKDFHYMQLERPIGNLVLRQDPSRLRYANLRVHSNNIQNTLESIEDTWAGLDPVHPVSYEFMDDQVARIINVYFDLLKIIGFLAVVAIAICCLGLFGIAAYTVETRTKEIGIRKVLGASVGRIIWTLSKGLAYPLLVAVVISLPAAWYLNRLWLESLAFHIPLTVFNLCLGIIIIASVAGLIMVSQSWRIARRNPVESLRYE